MMKFFRENTKVLLVVFGILLMIVFIGGPALEGMITPDVNRDVATTNGLKITLRDQRQAQSTTTILDTWGLAWQQMGGGGTPLELTDWILLVREAERLGMKADIAEIRSSASPDVINDLARNLQVRPDDILQALAEFNSVQQAVAAVGQVTTPSEAEVAAAARKSFERVSVHVAVIPAEAFVDENAEFTAEEFDTQFTAHRESEPGEGLNFGYYVEPTMQVQYIKIDRDVLAGPNQVRVANLDRKARSLYDARRESDPAFRRPIEELIEDATGDSVGPEAPKPEPYLSWDEAKEKAVEIIRRQEADTAAAQLADALIQRAANDLYDVDRGDDGYVVMPESVKSTDYLSKLVGHIPASLAYPDAVSITTTDFFDTSQADDVPDIGEGYYVPQRIGQYENLRSLTLKTRTMVSNIPDDKGINRSDYITAFQLSNYALKDRNGNVYIFRVIDSKAGHIPTSVDEVRDRVLTDLRLNKGFREAQFRAAALGDCEDSENLKDAYEKDEDLSETISAKTITGSGFLEPPPIVRASQYEVASGIVKTSVFAGGGLGKIPVDIVEQFFALEQADVPIAVFDLPSRSAVLVVEWIETQLTKTDEFDDRRESLLRQMAGQRSRKAIQDWLNPDNIRARNGFKLITG